MIQPQLFLVLILFICTQSQMDVRSAAISTTSNCTKSQYSFLVSIIRYERLPICGGSLIRRNWVLTAAHCCDDFQPLKDVSVVVGARSIESGYEQQSAIEAIFRHGDFQTVPWDNDICLLKLEQYLEVTDAVHISIPATKEEYGYMLDAGKCQRLITMGRGENIQSEKGYKTYIQCMSLSMVSREQCQAAPGRFLGDTNFCAIKIKNDDTTKVCYGDSGGPIYCGNRQIGIVSASMNGCGNQLTTGVYTRVDIFIEFINDVLFGKFRSEYVGNITELKMRSKGTSLQSWMCLSISLTTMLNFT